MPLSSDQKKTITHNIEKNTTGSCPMCGRKQWTLDSELQFLGALDPEYKQPISGQVHPVVTIICENCNYTAMFAAKRLGIIE